MILFHIPLVKFTASFTTTSHSYQVSVSVVRQYSQYQGVAEAFAAILNQY